jgi:serine/threonine-protein kinase
MPVRTSVGPGDIVGGKYTIEKLLGEGGMGLVFVAHHQKLNRRVAIKCLKPSVAQRPEAAIRLEREARAVAALESDHVTKVLDVGQLKDGAPYVVMELLEGEDLASVLTQGKGVPLEWAVHVILEVCDAVGEAHGLGIIHRDLKPANIFLHRRARANGGTMTKVLDFGISKVDDGEESGLTAASQIMGSPRYMSPEQLRNPKEVTASTDIWSLGATLYEVITGIPPFRGDSIAKLCTQIFTVDPVPPRTLRPEVPPALEDVVLRCLAKDPKSRFPTISALAEALGRSLPTASQKEAARPSLPSDPGRLWRAQSSPELPLLSVTTGMFVTGPDAPRGAPPLAPLTGTLHGVDAPAGHSENRTTSRLRWGLSFVGLVVVGGLALGAAALLTSPEPTVATGAAPAAAPPPATSSAPTLAAPPPPLPAPPPPSAPPSESRAPSTEPAPAPSASAKRPHHKTPPPSPSASSSASDPLDLPFAK